MDQFQFFDLRSLVQRKSLFGWIFGFFRMLWWLLWYLPGYYRSFPTPGETEKWRTYVAYLIGKTLDWHLVLIMDQQRRIYAGFHYQVMNIGELKVIWAEHFCALISSRYTPLILKQILRMLGATGAPLTAFELNVPGLMSAEELKDDDAAARIPLWIWLGACVLTTGDGRLVRYIQGPMDGQDAVECLALAWLSNTGEPLAGKTLQLEEFIDIYTCMMSTIVDVQTDASLAKVVKMARDLGVTEFEFEPLKTAQFRFEQWTRENW